MVGVPIHLAESARRGPEVRYRQAHCNSRSYGGRLSVPPEELGLACYGVETPGFQLKPSVFALRVNGILMLNASWEWMCASRCGFAYPTRAETSLDTGLLEANGFRWRRSIRHPLLHGLFKASVTLFQPAIHALGEALTPPQQRDYERYCAEKHSPTNPDLGPLFQSRPRHTHEVAWTDTAIEFDSITGSEGKTFRDTMGQVYSLESTAAR
jgi:hypothetical protein